MECYDSDPRLTRQEHFVSNGEGWLLHLVQTRHSGAFDASKPPVMVIPGYGMNGFIFGYHPRGQSMNGTLARAGHEVWTVNLRGQGASRRERPHADGPSMRAYADVDLAAAIDAAVRHTATDHDKLALIGCSLGGTIAYAHVALRPSHKVSHVIAIGSPLRWNEIHPLFSAALRYPKLVAKVKPRGARKLARFAVPLAAKVPRVLGAYMNPAHVDLSALSTLVETIEDPDARVNTDIALWVARKDLVIRGVNVTERLQSETIPLLVVVANRDGVVKESVTLSARDAWGGPKEVLRIGDDEKWYAHADLFIGDDAATDVFAPIVAWLERA